MKSYGKDKSILYLVKNIQMRKKENVLVEVNIPPIEQEVQPISWKVEKEHFTFYIHKRLDTGEELYYVKIESYLFQNWIVITEDFDSFQQALDFISIFND